MMRGVTRGMMRGVTRGVMRGVTRGVTGDSGVLHSASVVRCPSSYRPGSTS